MKGKRVSLADIADSLNVSKSTVSFVLNGKGKQFNISERTQQLILDKAKELNYVPNFFAKGLREGKTSTICLVLSDISNHFYSEMTKAIQEKLYDLGYSLFIVSTNDDPTMELKLMRDLILRGVDAMIISPCNDIPTLIPILDETPIPVVWVDRIGDNLGDFVGVDNVKESEKAIYKFSKTPKKVAILKPEQDKVMTIQLRVEGAINACKAKGYSFEEAVISEKNADSIVEGLIKNGCDSFLALNNQVALKTIGAFNRNKIEAPTTARLISFDDSESFSYMRVPISCVRQPITNIGFETVNRLMERLKESTENRVHRMLDCDFMERSSH